MKMNAELRNLAKNLKNTTVKAKIHPKTVAKANLIPKQQCGKRSGLPTDFDWRNFHYGVFDKVKRDHGRNDYLLAALARCPKRTAR